jgi:hypothetical protein
MKFRDWENNSHLFPVLQEKSEWIYLHSRSEFLHPFSSYLKDTQPKTHQIPDHLGLLEF